MAGNDGEVHKGQPTKSHDPDRDAVSETFRQHVKSLRARRYPTRDAYLKRKKIKQ